MQGLNSKISRIDQSLTKLDEYLKASEAKRNAFREQANAKDAARKHKKGPSVLSLLSGMADNGNGHRKIL